MPSFGCLGKTDEAAAIPRPEDFTSLLCCFSSISTYTIHLFSSFFIPCYNEILHAELASFQWPTTIFTSITDRNNFASANLRHQQYVFLFRRESKVHLA